MGLDKHTYIKDPIMFTHHVFGPDGNDITMTKIWENHAKVIPSRKKVIQLQAYENGYQLNTVLDVKVAGNIDMALVTTRAGRKFYSALDSTILTKRGMMPLRQVGVGTELVTLEMYKRYYGDQLKLDVSGNGRVRAFLRNHDLAFAHAENGGTLWNEYTFYCVDYDIDEPIFENETFTLGLNNYREFLMEELGLPEYAFDPVVSIKYPVPRTGLAVYVEGPQNVIVHNGVVLQTTQTELR